MSSTDLGEAHARDLRLVRAALAGDRGSTQELVRRLECIAPILHAVNVRLARPLSATDLEDVSQSAALVVWKKLRAFEGRARLESWVYRIASLELMNLYRKRRREPSYSAPEPTFGRSFEAQAPATLDAVEVDELERAVDALDPPLPTIIRLKHHEGLTFREIGDYLELSPNSAKTYYYRGIEELRARFAADGTAQRLRPRVSR